MPDQDFSQNPEDIIKHGPLAYWDNLGEGWRIDCLCGWVSGIGFKLFEAAEEFDDHLEEIEGEP